MAAEYVDKRDCGTCPSREVTHSVIIEIGPVQPEDLERGLGAMRITILFALLFWITVAPLYRAHAENQPAVPYVTVGMAIAVVILALAAASEMLKNEGARRYEPYRAGFHLFGARWGPLAALNGAGGADGSTARRP